MVFRTEAARFPNRVKAGLLEVELPRIYDPQCGCGKQINPVIACKRKSYTRAFERYGIALSKVMTPD